VFKILNLDPDRYSSRALSILKDYATVDNIDRKDNLSKIIHEYDILILRFSYSIDDALLSKAKKLKIIACNATGTDHIDMESANKRGVDIISLKDEVEFLRGIHATAELTWGLLLSLIRFIPKAHCHVLSGSWDRDVFFSNEIYGKRLGVVGYGRIGEKVAAYAQAFGMKVYAYDIEEKNYPDYVDSMNDLSLLVKNSDVLTIHVPYNKKTKNLIGCDLLKLMPKNSYLINTSRGAIIDETALVDALSNNKILGAAVDVLADEHSERFLIENKLIEYAKNNDNLIITPHIGGVTKESWEKTEVFIANKIVDKITVKG